jgi:galactose mutarotase-like enzyme
MAMTETIRIASDDLIVDIASLGAEMQSLASRDGRQWLWHGDVAFWAGRSPILFPIVGKAPGNRIGIDGQDYDMNQHGFARRSVFSVITAEAGRCVHVLRASDQTRSGYPFDFRLTVEHALSGRTLTVAAEVTNEDDCPLPFGIGFHPAFRWPLPGGEAHHHDIRLANGAEPADRKSTRLNSSHNSESRMPSSA